MKVEVLKGHLDALLLATLEAGPRHGYAIIDAVRTGSAGRIDLPTGTVYPALHRLERAGLVTSSWSTEPAPTAHLQPSQRNPQPASP
jgi:PadR family transcriptional regulator PadR